MKKIIVSALLGLVLAAGLILDSRAQVPIYTRGPSSSTSSVPSTAFPLLGAEGSKNAPSYSFSSATGAGMYDNSGGAYTGFAFAGNDIMFMASQTLGLVSNAVLGWTSTTSPGARDTILQRDAANTLALANAANAQTFRVYGTTTGPKYIFLQHDGSNGFLDTAASSGNLFIAQGNATSVIFGGTSRVAATQLRSVQQTAPTCSTNCGTSPSITGSDVAGVVTMGATGVPASGFVITFNGTWASAPSCTVTTALTSMVVGKLPIAVQTSTTTITVTTNGTAPGNADKYSYICFGVS